LISSPGYRSGTGRFPYNNDVRATSLVLLLATALILGSSNVSAQQQPPPPLPFPRSGGGPPPSAPAPAPSTPASPALPPAAPASRPLADVPTDASLGVPGIIYGNAEFLESFDIGRGQRCYLFGTNAGFIELVAYYKQVLKDGGRELFKAPAMQQFDLGRFQEQSMSAQPAVVVKDYAVGEGYLHVSGTQSKRFRTVIQIVPAPRP
jgi:hypothetical protein